MAIDRAAFEHLIPHRGAMCLLDHVVHWDSHRLVATSESHLHPENPLRRAGRLSAVHALEYGAQALAVHGGLRAEAAGGRLAAGLLAAGRHLHFYVPRLDNLAAALRIEVTEQYAQSGSMIYRFDIHSDQQPVAEGTAIVLGFGGSG